MLEVKLNYCGGDTKLYHGLPARVTLSFPRNLSPRKRGAGIQLFTQRFLDSRLRGSDNLFIPFIFQTSIILSVSPVLSVADFTCFLSAFDNIENLLEFFNGKIGVFGKFIRPFVIFQQYCFCPCRLCAQQIKQVVTNNNCLCR